MSFTKKSDYHYCDVSDVDEALLGVPRYPRRKGEDKHTLRICDKAYLSEAYLSRACFWAGVNITPGVIAYPIGDIPWALDNQIRAFGTRYWPTADWTNAAWLTRWASKPKTGVAYSTLQACITNALPPCDTLEYILGGGWYVAPGDALLADKIADAYTWSTELRYYRCSVSPLYSLGESPTYQYGDISNAGNFQPCIKTAIAYKLRRYESSDTGAATEEMKALNGEGMTLQTSPFFSISLSEPARSCLTDICVYALCEFNPVDMTGAKTQYQFVALQNGDGPSGSLSIVLAGKAIFPVETATGSDYTLTHREFHVRIIDLYVSAETKVLLD